MVRSAFPSTDIEIINKDFGENYNLTYDTASVYINISKNYLVKERDAQALLDFAYKGNTALISSAYFDTLLFNKIYCSQINFPFDNYYTNNLQTSLRISEGLNEYDLSYNYYYKPFANYFTNLNGSYARILGYNQTDSANFFIFFWGKGKILFHADPRAFSNYFLLTDDNHLYFQNIIKMFDGNLQNIYWDDFYNKKNYASSSKNSDGSLSNMLKFPPLAKAFFICLALLLFYILFNSKRKQREIPIVQTPKNTTIAFSEAIAGLYLQKHDNKVIADKMCIYFYEYLRTKYFFNYTVNDKDFAELLSKKSSVPLIKVQALANQIAITQSSLKITDTELLQLNAQVENFINKK
jgi:hypothetical protein